MSGRDVVVEALDAVMAGDPAVLAGFGLERLTASSPLWEERLTLDGAGRAELRTRRSIADVGGEAIGAFAHDAGPAAVRAVVQQLQRVPLFRLTPGGRSLIAVSWLSSLPVVIVYGLPPLAEMLCVRKMPNGN